MKVLIIGKTQVDLFPAQGDSRHRMPGKAEGSEFQRRVAADTLARKDVYGEQEGQELIEFAGRLCYESFDLPNEDTKTNRKYVRNIVKQGHHSVLEHVSVTFYVDGVSRNLSHELIRHRHLSFSEVSQRYVNMAEADAIIPPVFREIEPDLPVKAQVRGDIAYEYQHNLKVLEENGVTGKKARQAARYGLPAGMETKLVVTGNLRAWRDVLGKRYSKHADAEMQQFAEKVFDLLLIEYPDVFGDIEYGE